MDLSSCKILPIDFHVKIHNFFCTAQNEENPSYEITVNYMKEDNKKKWILQRSYSEISILHKILLNKFDSTPYLPSKIAHYLADKENKERARLVENYRMLNSLELRLFLNIEEELQVFLQPLILKQNLELDNFYPLQIDYWSQKRVCFVLTSEEDLDKKGAIKNVLSSFKKYFQKKTIKGVLYLLREKNLNTLNYEPFVHHDFLEIPTTFGTIESMQFICVGFTNGEIQTFYTNQNFQLEKRQVINAHQQQINQIFVIPDKALILSFGNDSSFNYMEFQAEKNFSQEFNFFKQRITCVFYVKRKNLIFLGDEKGYLYVYIIQQNSQVPFKLALNQFLRESSIQGVSLSKNDKYLFVAFYDGQIEVYDLGTDFSSKPTFIQNYQTEKEINDFVINKQKSTLVTNEKNGTVSFYEVLNYQNTYSQKLHKQKIKGFKLIEYEKLLMTVALDKKVKFFQYQENLNNKKYNPIRGLQYFDENLIENYCLPTNELINIQKIQTSNMQSFEQQNVKQVNIKKEEVKSESSESDEEDMRDWNQLIQFSLQNFQLQINYCIIKSILELIMKKILITGANQGLGFQNIKSILQKKLPYNILATSRTQEKYNNSLRNLEKDDLPTHGIKNYILDLNNKDSVEDLVKHLKKNKEHLDVLVNNAGVLSWKMDHDYKQILRVNFTNTKLLTERILENNLMNDNGKIIFMQGLLGNINDTQKELQDDFLNDTDLDQLCQKIIDNYKEISKNDKIFTSSYRLSKMLIAKYLKNLSQNKDIIKKNISVYGIHPGWVSTNMGTSKGPVPVEQGVKPFEHLLDLPFEINEKYQGYIIGKKNEVIDVFDKKIKFQRHF